MISVAAFSTADLVNGKIAGLPVRQSSNWSLKCGDLGLPLWPIGITKRVASQFPGVAMKRIETLEPTFGVCPLPAIPTVGVEN